jgi:hypothetical protein
MLTREPLAWLRPHIHPLTAINAALEPFFALGPGAGAG